MIGHLIADDLDLAAGRYQRNPAGVPHGTYYIQRTVSDCSSARVRVTAPGQVRIDNPHPRPCRWG